MATNIYRHAATIAIIAGLGVIAIACHRAVSDSREAIASCLSRIHQLPEDQQRNCMEAFRKYREKQLPHVMPVADAIKSTVLKIDEKDNGVVEILIDLAQLEKCIGPVVYSNGVLAFSHKGHSYKAYTLLLARECVIGRVEGTNLLLAIAAPPDRRKREFIGECGKYELNMIEDGHNLWSWDLMPAFHYDHIPNRGGPITAEELVQVERENTVKLSCDKPPEYH